LCIDEVLGEFEWQQEQGAGDVKRRAVVIMSVGDEVVDGLVARTVGFQHLGHDGILRELVRLEERDHHLVLCAGVVGEDENDEINEADEEQGDENALLCRGHAAIIPFRGA
jgi:hypothetical protein